MQDSLWAPMHVAWSGITARSPPPQSRPDWTSHQQSLSRGESSHRGLRVQYLGLREVSSWYALGTELQAGIEGIAEVCSLSRELKFFAFASQSHEEELG